MEFGPSAVVKKPLFSWVYSKNRCLQLLLVLVAFLAVFASLLPLEMQKRIVNEAINLKKFDQLVHYCAIYLAALLAASGLKYVISILQNVIGQRTTADMRKALYGHALTLPLSFYRKTQPGLVVTALIGELATAGDFIGMAVAVPATNLLMALAFGGYLLWLNPLLAVISFSIYPLVLLLVPVLQKNVNVYNRKRVNAGRRVSGKVGEAVAGVHEIQTNSAFATENRKFGRLVDRLRHIRIVWNLYRQAVKRVNGLFTNFSRFLIFGVGGYLAIKGRLELGALVAFLSAQEKLYSPWKELIQFYQAYQTAKVTYSRTMDYFDVQPEHALAPSTRQPYDLKGNILVENLSFKTEDGTELLSGINLDMQHGSQLALVGFSGSGKSTLAQCLVQLQRYTGGRILLGGKEISQLTKKDIAFNTGFVSQAPFIFEGTVEENLLYGYLSKYDGGRPPPAAERLSLDDKILVLQQTGLFLDVLRFGLNTVLHPEQQGDLADRILNVRSAFRRQFGGELAGVIEIYDPDRFLCHSSVAENLMFTDALRAPFAVEDLAGDEQFARALEETGLRKPLLKLGGQISEKLVAKSDSRAEETPPQDDLMPPQEISDFKKILYRVRGGRYDRIGKRDSAKLLRVALGFTPARHGVVRLSDALKSSVIEARPAFKGIACEEAPGDRAACRRSDYLFSQSILGNIVFGKVKDESPEARNRINTSLHRLLVMEDLLEEIVQLGLQHEVGTKGNNLSGGQRQKLAIARVFLKKPPVLIMDEATSGLDNDSQARIQEMVATQWKGASTVISVVHRLDIVQDYDTVAVMKGGRIVETGDYRTLMGNKGTFYRLVRGKK